jgi:hypothetical protein
VGSANSLRETAARLRSQVSERLERVVGGSDGVAGGDNDTTDANDDKSGRYKILVDMAAASRETLASLHEGVQHKVFKQGEPYLIL